MSFDGLLNSTCTVQVKTSTQASDGQMVESWATEEASVPCRLDENSDSGLVVTSSAEYERAPSVVFMRKPSSYTITTATHRLLIGSDAYNIIRVKDKHTQVDTHHLELAVEFVK